MNKEAYDSYVKKCKANGMKPSSKKDLERWEDVEVESKEYRGVHYEGTPFSQLPGHARVIVTKNTLKNLYEKTYLEGFSDGKAEGGND